MRHRSIIVAGLGLALAALVSCATAPPGRYAVMSGVCPYCDILDRETGQWYKGDLEHPCKSGDMWDMLWCVGPIQERTFGSGGVATPPPGGLNRDGTLGSPRLPDVYIHGPHGHLTTGHYDAELDRYNFHTFGK